MFDTIGTAIGVADKANLLDKDGNLPKAGRVLTSDAIGNSCRLHYGHLHDHQLCRVQLRCR